MGCSVSQYRFKKRSYWLVVFSIPAHNPCGNAEVTSCDCLLTPQCQIASKLHTHRGLGFAHTSQGTFQSACKEEIWEHLAWHFGAAVLQLKSKPFRTGLGLYCFAWLSLFLSAGTEAAGLAAFVPRWSLESAAKAVLLIRASGLLWQTKAGRGWVCARAVRTSLSQAALRTKQQQAEKLREHFITCESWFNGKLDKLEIGGLCRKSLVPQGQHFQRRLGVVQSRQTHSKSMCLLSLEKQCHDCSSLCGKQSPAVLTEGISVSPQHLQPHRTISWLHLLTKDLIPIVQV